MLEVLPGPLQPRKGVLRWGDVQLLLMRALSNGRGTLASSFFLMTDAEEP